MARSAVALGLTLRYLEGQHQHQTNFSICFPQNQTQHWQILMDCLHILGTGLP